MPDAKPRPRIITLDLLRGFLLVVILVDHLAKFPNVLEVFTGKGWLWASAAEGFFIISGIMVGLIKGRQVVNRGLKYVTKNLWKRAANLYVWSVSLTILFTLIGWAMGSHAGIKLGLASNHSLIDLVWRTISFQYVYGWADFLTYYAVFMFAAPLFLWLIVKRRWWIALFASLIVWRFRIENFYAALQILFVGGMIVGYYMPQIEKGVAALSITVRRMGKHSLYAAAALTMTLSAVVIHGRTWLGLMSDQLSIRINQYLQVMADSTGPWFDKWTMAPGRVLLAALWFSALYVFIRSHETTINRYLGWLLLPLGQNSKQVYIFQSFIVYFAWLIWPTGQGFILNNLITLAGIALLAEILFVYTHGRFPGYPPGRYLKDRITQATFRPSRR